MTRCCAIFVSLFGGYFLAAYAIDQLGKKLLGREDQYELNPSATAAGRGSAADELAGATRGPTSTLRPSAHPCLTSLGMGGVLLAAASALRSVLPLFAPPEQKSSSSLLLERATTRRSSVFCCSAGPPHRVGSFVPVEVEPEFRL